ncbi:MAG: hypothetical protein JXP36_17470, partial [Bacteroidales bacterium]|nr:hypothetical protein [Bacteroidales bacterium]
FIYIIIVAGLSIFCFTEDLIAQVPEMMSYQAVIRDENKQLVLNSTVTIRVSILHESILSEPVFMELHSPQSNENGLVTLEIGNGQAEIGDFTSIDWSDGIYFIKTETDPKGNFDFTLVGTSQLLTVPFAFHAKTAERVSGLNDLISDALDLNNVLQLSPSDTARWNNKLESLSGTESVFYGWDINASDDFSGKYNDLTGTPTRLSSFTNDAGYINNENDPVFQASVAYGITASDIANWNSASVGAYVETDPEFTAWDKSTGIVISKSQISDLSFEVFEKELSDDENNIDVGFDLQATSIVFINGITLPSNKWTGIGTHIITLEISIEQYDELKVKK